MTATTSELEAPRATTSAPGVPEAVRSAVYIGIREVRNVLRAPADFLPGLFIPVFFYFIQVASLSKFATTYGLPNYKAFQLPVGVLFAASNGGSGLNMVMDIESGYFDKLLVTPVNRLALLIGAMGADFARIVVQSSFVVALAMVAGLHFETGVLGSVVLILMASLWGLVYSAIGFGIALKTGSPAATQSAWVFFFPLIFVAPSFAPLSALSGWLHGAAKFNPVTYLLGGMRALSMTGWSAHDIGLGFLAIGAMGAITVTIAFRGLLSRVK
jgi:ABC-2 type transport system permease protein